MTTRCRIIFTANGEDQVATYRHSDGYPSGVLPDLQTFQDFLKQGQRYDSDVEYTAANWIFWSKLQLHNQYCIKTRKDPDHKTKNATCLIGFGICNHKLHGDEKFEYIVDISTQPYKITHRGIV